MKYSKKAAAVAVVIVCIASLIITPVVFSNGEDIPGKGESDQVPFKSGEFYKIATVIDGDTFKIRFPGIFGSFLFAGTISVRMLGVDTPETVDPRKLEQCYGKEASEETKHLLGGRSVRLEFESKREVRDKYGRYLAYVYLDDGLFINEYLIRNGYAREYTFGKAYSMQKEFRRIESQAKKSEKGLWAECE